MIYYNSQVGDKEVIDSAVNYFDLLVTDSTSEGYTIQFRQPITVLLNNFKELRSTELLKCSFIDSLVQNDIPLEYMTDELGTITKVNNWEEYLEYKTQEIEAIIHYVKTNLTKNQRLISSIKMIEIIKEENNLINALLKNIIILHKLL